MELLRKMNSEQLEAVVLAFAEAEVDHIEPLGEGYIHQTYKVEYTDPEQKPQVLQKINTSIFSEPEKLMSNLNLVTDHIQQRLQGEGDKKHRMCLSYLPTRNDEVLHRDEKGGCWRIMDYIEDSVCHQELLQARHAIQAGAAFASFHESLRDLDAKKIHEVIAGFHDTVGRMNDLKKALAKDPFHRSGKAQRELEVIYKAEKDFSVIVDGLKGGALKTQVIHNDPKINNILFDRHDDSILCVIDLDTVMPGSILYDFGDLIRSGASSAPEDEVDLEKVIFDFAKFKHMSQGYLSKSKSFLSAEERRQLVLACRLITIEQAVRFLTDYINGDVYYKTEREGQNLDRTRTQIKLFEDMQAAEKAMEDWVNSL